MLLQRVIVQPPPHAVPPSPGVPAPAVDIPAPVVFEGFQPELLAPPYLVDSALKALGMLVALAAIIFIGGPIARALARRIDRRTDAPLPSADVTARLERIEQAVDAIAIEVERISEGQRFSSRLLAEQRGGALPARTDTR